MGLTFFSLQEVPAGSLLSLKCCFLVSPLPLDKVTYVTKRIFFFLDFSLYIGNVCKEEVGAEHLYFIPGTLEWMKASGFQITFHF